MDGPAAPRRHGRFRIVIVSRPRRAASVTVGIIARNARGTVRTAVRSALRDRHVSRVLVWDDGSDDGTSSVLGDLDDARLIVAGTAENHGIPASRNAVLERVDTPHLAWLDADDLCLPGRFGAQLSTLDRGHDIVFTPVVEWLHGTPAIRPQLVPALSPEATPFHLLLGNPFMNPTMLARTEVLRELGGYRTVASEDYELWIRAALGGYRLHRTLRPFVVYRRHRAQTTQQASWRAARSETTIVEEGFDRLAERTIGFSPSWFAWQRAGRPSGEVPANLLADADRFDRAIRRLPPAERAPLRRQTRRLRSLASTETT